MAKTDTENMSTGSRVRQARIVPVAKSNSPMRSLLLHRYERCQGHIRRRLKTAFFLLLLPFCFQPSAFAACAFNAAGALGEAALGNITLGAPASPATNDVWVAAIFSKDNVAHTFTDWTELVNVDGSGASAHFSVWYFRYAGSTPNLIVTHSSGGPIVGGIAALRGCDTVGSPVDATGLGATNASANDTTIEHTTITPTTSNTLVLMLNGQGNDTTRTPESGYTAAFNPGSGNSYVTTLGSDSSVAIHYKAHVSGATGTLTDTHGGAATEFWVSVLVAIEQAAVSRRPVAPVIFQ